MNHDDTPRQESYYDQAKAADEALDATLADIRAREDAGELTPAESVRLRIDAMEHHAGVLRVLKATYLGEEEQP